jgi:hypothetical protein
MRLPRLRFTVRGMMIVVAGGLDNLIVQAAKPQEDGAEPRILRGAPTSRSGLLSLRDPDDQVVLASRV